MYRFNVINLANKNFYEGVSCELKRYLQFCWFDLLVLQRGAGRDEQFVSACQPRRRFSAPIYNLSNANTR